jgi:hypothetical protein
MKVYFLTNCNFGPCGPCNIFRWVIIDWFNWLGPLGIYTALTLFFYFSFRNLNCYRNLPECINYILTSWLIFRNNQVVRERIFFSLKWPIIWLLLLLIFYSICWLNLFHLFDFLHFDKASCTTSFDKHPLCTEYCPPRGKPSGYPDPRKQTEEAVIYARNVISCWTVCEEKMTFIASNNKAWWEFWIRAPSAAEIADFKKRELKEAYDYLDICHQWDCIRQKSQIEVLERNELHKIGTVVFFCFLFFFSLIALLFAVAVRL